MCFVRYNTSCLGPHQTWRVLGWPSLSILGFVNESTDFILKHDWVTSVGCLESDNFSIFTMRLFPSLSAVLSIFLKGLLNGEAPSFTVSSDLSVLLALVDLSVVVVCMMLKNMEVLVLVRQLCTSLCNDKVPHLSSRIHQSHE